MNHEAVHRTAPATPGLLIIFNIPYIFATVFKAGCNYVSENYTKSLEKSLKYDSHLKLFLKMYAIQKITNKIIKISFQI